MVFNPHQEFCGILCPTKRLVVFDPSLADHQDKRTIYQTNYISALQ